MGLWYLQSIFLRIGRLRKDRQIWPTAITDQTSTTISDLFDAYTANKDITEHLRKLFDSHLGRII